ncbi:putative P-loop containing nucleoside triphosphate hydrolase, leucine-rich repeat domain superfamily [Helianthus debilis subsp. tardiflorus]
METRVKNVVSSLEIDSDDVRIIGIKGIGGGGKTTLARAVFDHISSCFEGKSFVKNVREVSKGSSSGLKELQRQVLQDALDDQRIDVKSVSDGKNMMERMMGSRKVLVVLDDVDDIDQLEALAGKPNWFKPGSRIIVTTRDEYVLLASRVKFIHDVDLLSHEEAISLFSWYAFGREIPIQGYEELSEGVVDYAAGLPLTIKVLGSFFCGKIKREWEHAIERPKTIPLNAILEKMEVSYNGLENDQKEIFLDVACILKGAMKDKAIRVLESRGFNAELGLKVLEQKSLITLSSDGHLLLHNHIEEMGWNIVRRVDPGVPSRHSRLWIKEEIEDILINGLGTEATRSIKLLNTCLSPDIIMNGLTKMTELRFVYMDNGYETYAYASPSSYKNVSLPNALQYLYWWGYPLSCLPETFRANNLVNLEMPNSNISRLWEGGERKVLKKLKFLDLSYSKLRTFDLGMTPNLEELHLRECNDFEELHISVECLKLKFLDLSGSKVSKLNLALTPSLEELHLEECYDLVKLHMPVECPNLEILSLNGSRVSNLNLGLTPLLWCLDVEECYNLQEIQASVGCLKKLACLNLNRDSVVKKHLKSPGFDFLAMLKVNAECVDDCPLHPHNNLPKFQFECFYDEHLTLSSGNLEKLISFGLCACTNLESFSASICGLQRLGKLTLEGDIREAPKDLYQLQSLEELTLSMKKINRLPDSICRLKHLKSLELKSCFLLEQLPKDLGRLECLEKLHLLDCISLPDIPNSICEMKCLKYLHLPYCVLVENLPVEVGRLKYLKELNIQGTGINRLPDGIIELKGLCIIWSMGRLESYGFTSVKKLSKYTASCYV